MERKYEALDKVADDPIDRLTFWRNDEPVCPHCGATISIDRAEWYDIYQEGEHEKECTVCDGAFTISTHVEYKFSTDEQP
jgi:hypothetical protein